jgi:hypothetical protein
MIIKRKLFASSPQQLGQEQQMSSKDLQLEQGKLQRELLKTQRMKQRMQAEERDERIKRTLQLQKMEQRKDIEEDKARIRVKKLEDDNNENKSLGLYKSKPHPVAPVSMK